jgi:hypothetical protein
MQKTILLICTICTFFIAQAQTLQTPCTTTNQATAGNIVVNYTIGEMVLVDNYKSNGLFITQGIMQPDVPSAIINYNAFTTGEITVFPNPTPNDLSLQIGISKPGKMTLQLVDALGQIILYETFTVNTFMTKKYNLTKHSSGTYVLKVLYKSTDGQLDKIGSYKIVKTL